MARTITITTTAEIKPTKAPSSGRQGYLRGLTPTKITKALGIKSVGKSGDGKSNNGWYFEVAGIRCGIWDYYGSDSDGIFSYSGTREMMVAIFGAEHVS